MPHQKREHIAPLGGEEADDKLVVKHKSRLPVDVTRNLY